MELSRTTLGIAAGVAGTLFLGYCVYFDQQRRKDPLFKKKLRDRRRTMQQNTTSKSYGGPLPDMNDHEAVQRFFIQQIQLGEELIAAGDMEAGVVHLGQAVAVCGQAQQLLSVLQQTLPAPSFHLLLKKLPEISERIRVSIRGENTLLEEDVE